MDKQKHKALHVLFGDASPLQQIQRISSLDSFFGNKGNNIFELIDQKKRQDDSETYEKGIVVDSSKLWLPYSHHSVKPTKIKNADLKLFDQTIYTEHKIRTILEIADTALTDQCKQDILNILA